VEYEREEEFGTVAGGLEHKGRQAGGRGFGQVEPSRPGLLQGQAQAVMVWTGGINEPGRARRNVGGEMTTLPSSTP
jgi:hypothetical protein